MGCGESQPLLVEKEFNFNSQWKLKCVGIAEFQWRRTQCCRPVQEQGINRPVRLHLGRLNWNSEPGWFNEISWFNDLDSLIASMVSWSN
jgi:hypothetical protein